MKSEMIKISKKKISLISLGCSKNLVDSEFLIGGLKNENFEIIDSPEESDIVIVNTCGFLDKAREESVETILEFGELKNSNSIGISSKFKIIMQIILAVLGLVVLMYFVEYEEFKSLYFPFLTTLLFFSYFFSANSL